VYAVVYSLLLLNTDLHVAQGNHARMTRSEFIRNTMSTIRDQRNHEEAMEYKKRSAITTRNWEAEVENYMKVRQKFMLLIRFPDFKFIK
jgi:Sec7-like guanine-nucleotide exchange factor